MERKNGNKKGWGRILIKALGVGALGIVGVYLVAGAIWKYTGSNTWEFKQENNGVKVYTLKAPGSSLLQVRGVVTIRSTLDGMVEFMQDPTVCDKIGCYESRMIDHVDDSLQYYTFRYDYPLAFKTREFVVKLQAYQFPESGEVLLEFTSAPEKLPNNDCCFRITDLKNSWKLRPLGNGEIEVQYTMNMNEGGFLPPILVNTIRPQVMLNLLPSLERLVSEEKYQEAQFEFISK